jgi:hypothetical protein
VVVARPVVGVMVDSSHMPRLATAVPTTGKTL